MRGNTIFSWSSISPVCCGSGTALHMAFKLPYIYDYIAKLCRQ
jgi:hypothetical protein